MLVVAIPPGAGPRVSEELWLPDGSGPRRFMVWGRFDEFIVAEILAKELRAVIRKKGVVTQTPDAKSRLLAMHIKMRLNGEQGSPWA